MSEAKPACETCNYWQTEEAGDSYGTCLKVEDLARISGGNCDQVAFFSWEGAERKWIDQPEMVTGKNYSCVHYSFYPGWND